ATTRRPPRGPPPRGTLRPPAITMRVTHSNKERCPLDFPSCRSYAHLHRLERSQRLQRRQQVSATALQPPRHAIGACIGLRVHADANHAAEEHFFITGANHSQINLSDIVPASTKLLPGPQRNLFAADPQRLGKIIAAAGRHHEEGLPLVLELRKGPMHSAVATKDEGCRHAGGIIKTILNSDLSAAASEAIDYSGRHVRMEQRDGGHGICDQTRLIRLILRPTFSTNSLASGVKACSSTTRSLILTAFCFLLRWASVEESAIPANKISLSMRTAGLA